jgi:L-threonylcarbamoyladenylate synthase
MTEVVTATADSLHQAAQTLRLGGLVAFPTETVYGLGADAENPAAVARVFAAKGRPADHPLIVHLAGAEQLDRWAHDVPAAAYELAAAFWPGPLTLILKRSSRASDLVTGGLDTVGLRVPSHSVAQELLQAFGGVIAAPSANRFGRVSPTTAEHVLTELDGRIDLILDGGPCQVGLESTIVDLSRGEPVVLRPGGVTVERLTKVLGPLGTLPAATAPRVSGALDSHYAPRTRLILVPTDSLAQQAELLASTGKRVVVLTADHGLPLPDNVERIAWPAEQSSLASALYASLRAIDALDVDVALASVALRQIAICIDPPVAEEGPMGANDVDQPKSHSAMTISSPSCSPLATHCRSGR